MPKRITAIFLRVDQLLTHPRNMRHIYLQEEVEQMARSIKGRNGVIHALRIVPISGQRCRYHVVDGNLRLAGARLLGQNCPLLKCEVVNETEAEQLLDMIVANKVRSDPDPISEASHYQVLTAEGYTPEQIAEQTGVHLVTIQGRLILLKLEPEIQDLIAHGKLPRDRRVADALLSVPAGKPRIQLARRLAALETPIRGIQAACQKFLEARPRQSRHALPEERHLTTPTLELPENSGSLPNDTQTLGWPALREAARNMCAACDLKLEMLNDIPEPAWALITHMARETCEICPMPKLASTCNGCPGVELIRRLIMAAQARVEAQHVRGPVPSHKS